MKKLMVWAAALAFAGVGATEFMVECDAFPKPDGFVVEFMGAASGGKYLRMNKRNVETTARVAIPEAGDYYLWVRDFSYAGNTRKAVVLLNDKKAGTFGDKKLAEGTNPPAWNWTRSPLKTHLEAGELKITVKAQSDYARFDMMILTTDENYKPEGKVDDVAELEVFE
ncbi:MAG: hypothetical protein MJ016_07625 [Victivallaceae bacterium]|nr:hypothetical protein [Victivallaceae bacterium]